MIEAPASIQRALDETFPGIRLEFNERTGYWVLVDDLYMDDGSVCLNAAYPPPGGLIGLEPYPLTRRAIIWALGDPRTGERWEPHADLILNALYKSFNGARIDAIEQFIDRIEDGEAAQAERDKQPMRERVRETAAEVWDRYKAGRATFSSAGASTPWKVDRELERKRKEKEQETAHADAVASEMISAGEFARGVIGGR